jgi:hypothetical protein
LRVAGSGSRNLGLGSTIFGFRVQDFGFRVHDFGFRVHDFGFRVYEFEFRVHDFGSGSTVLSLEFGVKRLGFRNLGFYSKNDLSGFKVFGVLSLGLKTMGSTSSA